MRTELHLAGVDDRTVLTLSGASGTFIFPSEEVPTRPWPMYRPAEATPHQPPMIPRASVVLVFGIPDLDPVADGWLKSLLPSTTLIWDRQGWLSRARNSDAILALSAERKIYLANKEEATEESKGRGMRQATMPQPPDGFDVAAIKQGVNGVDVYVRHGLTSVHEHISAFPVHAKSTVGSGDVFAGVFAGRLALGDSPVAAAEWGCAAASIALQANDILLRDSDRNSIAALLRSRCL